MKFSHQYLKSAALLISALVTLPNVQAETAFKTFNGIPFVKIAPGCFQMGGNASFKETLKAELPAHRVCIEKAFYLGETEVTQAQWTAVMGSNPSKFNVGVHPVERVSWDDTQEFIKRLNEHESSAVYRLPTEAEWEYAARAGSDALYSFGDNANNLSKYAWYGNEGYGGRTSPVRYKQPNAWGLYDMQGNVWEWVQDWYSDSYYANSPENDPKGPETGKFKVYRGGSWVAKAANLRTSIRFSGLPNSRSRDIGFRLVRQAE
jgi:formylglycine-generating enzyme required for sulfatase activity